MPYVKSRSTASDPRPSSTRTRSARRPPALAAPSPNLLLESMSTPAPHTGPHRQRPPKTHHPSPHPTPINNNNAAAAAAAPPHTVAVVVPDHVDGSPQPKGNTHAPPAPVDPKDEGGGAAKNNMNTGAQPVANAEVSAVPDPVPQPDKQSNAPAQSPTVSIHTSPLFAATKTPDTVIGIAQLTATSTPLMAATSPLLSVLSSSSMPPPSLSSASASAPSTLPASDTTDALLPSDAADQTTSLHPTLSHHTIIVAALAVGGACILGAIFIVLKLWSRPRRRTHPTPSLPILQDSFSSQKGDDSPIFGGKERLSSRPPSNAVIFPWTQYHSGIPRPPPPRANTGSEDDVPFSQRRYSRLEEDMPVATIQHATAASYAQPTVQLVSERAPRNVSRLSTMSVAYVPPPGQDIGVAVTSGPGLARNPSGARASVRRSMRDFDHGKRRSTMYTEAETLPYSSSPSMPLDVAGDPGGASYGQGRARIKAPYGVGSYLRASTATSAAATKRASMATEMNPFDEATYAVPPIPTHAPRAASPGPSLYPDDSLSVAGDRRRAPAKKAPGPAKAGSPGMEASAAVGNLMLSDYRASKMSPALSPRAGSVDESGDAASAMDGVYDYDSDRDRGYAYHKRADDKPPRVPSPPPLPSLAQMALAHTHPDDYADYRSPTYSIYGLYDPDRKSRADGGY
ncbi:hypothetical protein FA95DRAFT_43633 [Auriscalpium vulgare]|uniref:Uncharacterized protein n=1 Tax=Auriscalpium vulgare TaxID=40419 RepID=A0ACB8SDY7_9AGAM|nr:hypothetical protein FA95DRAFT_43633 [Auriscalpium vulgare]